jgi:hypothetical protein
MLRNFNLRDFFNYLLVLLAGGMVALGISWLAGLIYDPASLPVFVAIWVWWCWVGWRYSKRREAAKRRGMSIDLS